MSIKDQLVFAGKRAEIWDHPSTVIDEAAGTVTVNSNEISGGLNEVLYGNQRMLLSRMRGWQLTSEGGIDTFTSPQQVAKQKAADSSKESAEILKKLRAHLPKDRSSLWNSEGVVKSNSDGEDGVFIDLTKYENQPFITDTVFRDLDSLHKANWQTNFCRTGALWVHVFPRVEQPTYATAKDALAAEFNGESWVEQGEEGYRGEVTYRASDMSGNGFRCAVEACYIMANKKGWKGSRPMRSFLQPLTGKSQFDRVIFVAPEQVLQDA